MPAYQFRAVHRQPDGIVGPTLHAQVIEAATPEDAVTQARTIDLDMAALGANAVYLTDPTDGRAIWTLHSPAVDQVR